MTFGCQVINLTFKFKLRYACIRGMLILLFLLILLPLLLLFFAVLLPIVMTVDGYKNTDKKCVIFCCFCVPGAMCKVIFWKNKGPFPFRKDWLKHLNLFIVIASRLLISVPFWLILCSVSFVLGVAITALFIAPAWLLSMVSIIKMIFWWQKRDRVQNR